MRVMPALLAAALFVAPALAEKPVPDVDVTFEPNTYRYGDLYQVDAGTSVEACALRCSTDSACASWSFIPESYELGSRCELKRNPGMASYRPGVASGMSEVWQMDPARHSEMRYTPIIPATIEAPNPSIEPDLMGGPETRISATMRPAPMPTADSMTPLQPLAPTIVETVELTRGPAQGAAPAYVKQPPPVEPHPLYRLPKPAATKASASTVFKDPSRAATPAMIAPEPTPVPQAGS